MKKYIILFTLLVVGCNLIVAQTKEEKKKMKEETAIKNYETNKEIINSGVYGFNPRSAKGGRRSVSLSGNSNSLVINKDKASGNFPFFGASQSTSYSGDGSIVFNVENVEYDIKYNDDKRRIDVSFKAITKGETFDVKLSITGERSASVTVLSMKRDRMSYNGKITPITITE
jgi:hypothetical protein